MGKEARERKERRHRTLATLAKEDPHLFEQKWNEKLNTWASEIWRYQTEQVHFTARDYDSFISIYPKAKHILADLLRSTRHGYSIDIDKLNAYQQEELGADAFTALMSRVCQGGLRGKKVFDIADRAQQVLANCGEKAMALQRHETAEFLTGECCRAIADPDLNGTHIRQIRH